MLEMKWVGTSVMGLVVVMAVGWVVQRAVPKAGIGARKRAVVMGRQSAVP